LEGFSPTKEGRSDSEALQSPARRECPTDFENYPLLNFNKKSGKSFNQANHG
jgi:hypothetical protein